MRNKYRVNFDTSLIVQCNVKIYFWNKTTVGTLIRIKNERNQNAYILGNDGFNKKLYHIGITIAKLSNKIVLKIN